MFSLLEVTFHPRKATSKKIDGIKAPNKGLATLIETTKKIMGIGTGQEMIMKQLAYKLKCLKCNHKYGANGTDIFQRKCPNCQGGKPGISY